MADDEFSIEVDQIGTTIVVHAHGVMGIATCEQIRDALAKHLGPRQALVIDLSGLEFADSSFLGVLVQARATLTADAGSLVVRNPSQAASRLLTLAGAEDLLEDHIDGPDAP